MTVGREISLDGNIVLHDPRDAEQAAARDAQLDLLISPISLLQGIVEERDKAVVRLVVRLDSL